MIKTFSNFKFIENIEQNYEILIYKMKEEISKFKTRKINKNFLIIILKFASD